MPTEKTKIAVKLKKTQIHCVNITLINIGEKL